MLNNDQLIAVAEVLGWKNVGLYVGGIRFDRMQGVPPEWQSTNHDVPDYLTSLDACFADIVPWMRREGWLFHLENSCADPEPWFCTFSKIATRHIKATAPTAPRAIVKAFLMHNNRWTDQPDNQTKGGSERRN